MNLQKEYKPEEPITPWYEGLEEVLKEAQRDIKQLIQNYDTRVLERGTK